MPSTTTANMNLIVPTVGQEPGPAWANDINGDLGILDQHDHSSGSGVPVTPAGLNINSDLTFNENNATELNTVRFHALGASLPGTSPNLGVIYVAGNELYYNDEVGNVVPITNNGSVNAGAGSITGLPSGTASASYSSVAKTFVWQSSTSTPANMDGGSFIFRNILANSHGVTVEAPAALGADYSLVLPTIPGSTEVVTLDNSGNMGTQTYDQVGQNMTSTGANAIANTRTRTTGSTVGVGGVAISSSSGNFTVTSTSETFVTGVTVTITTSGRPVMISVQPDGNLTNSSGIGSNNPGSLARAVFGFKRDGTFINLNQGFLILGVSPTEITYPPSSVAYLDIVAAGTYTYELWVFGVDVNTQVLVSYCVITAYEI